MMKIVKAKKIRSSAFRAAAFAACALLLSGCDPNLDVPNPNNPDREAALATGSDVESIIVSSFVAYHNVAHSALSGVVNECGGNAWMSVLNAMADHTTSNWANYGFSDTAGQPREALPNSQADPDACLMTPAWFRAYQGLASAAEGLRAMDEGVDIGEGGANNARARAWAKLSQGLIHAQLSILFDQGFIVDETVQLVDESGNAVVPEFASYREMNQAAMGYFDRAIEIASTNDFTTPATWLDGQSLTSDELIALIHSYKARYMARWPRSPSEAQEVDWAAVQSNLEQGHEGDFTQEATGTFWGGLDVWTDWGGAALQLSFIDNKTVGPADQSGAYQAWLNAPVNESTPFDIQSPDQRIPEPVQTVTTEGGSEITNDFGCNPAAIFGVPVAPGGAGTGPVPDNPACGMAPSFIGYTVSTFMPPQRGVIGLSHYTRYEPYFGPCDMIEADFTFDGTVCDFTQFDKDMLMAEALMRQGQAQAAADILNKHREGAGIGEVGPNGVSGENCVPRMPDGSCADFLHTLAYEKGLLVSSEHAGDMWADKRRWGMLTTGTAKQLPVPAAELATINEEIYTFGGDAGSAAPVIVPGDKESILRKIHWSLNVLEAQRQERLSERPSVSLDRSAPTIVR